jgi:hypothetical protein
MYTCLSDHAFLAPQATNRLLAAPGPKVPSRTMVTLNCDSTGTEQERLAFENRCYQPYCTVDPTVMVTAERASLSARNVGLLGIIECDCLKTGVSICQPNVQRIY